MLQANVYVEVYFGSSFSFLLSALFFVCLAGLAFCEVVLLNGIMFDLAVLMYHSTTDDRIDFSSLSYTSYDRVFLSLLSFLFPSSFGLRLVLEIVLDEIVRYSTVRDNSTCTFV